MSWSESYRNILYNLVTSNPQPGLIGILANSHVVMSENILRNFSFITIFSGHNVRRLYYNIYMFIYNFSIAQLAQSVEQQTSVLKVSNSNPPSVGNFFIYLKDNSINQKYKLLDRQQVYRVHSHQALSSIIVEFRMNRGVQLPNILRFTVFRGSEFRVPRFWKERSCVNVTILVDGITMLPFSICRNCFIYIMCKGMVK